MNNARLIRELTSSDPRASYITCDQWIQVRCSTIPYELQNVCVFYKAGRSLQLDKYLKDYRL